MTLMDSAACIFRFLLFSVIFSFWSLTQQTSIPLLNLITQSLVSSFRQSNQISSTHPNVESTSVTLQDAAEFE